MPGVAALHSIPKCIWIDHLICALIPETSVSLLRNKHPQLLLMVKSKQYSAIQWLIVSVVGLRDTIASNSRYIVNACGTELTVVTETPRAAQSLAHL